MDKEWADVINDEYGTDVKPTVTEDDDDDKKDDDDKGVSTDDSSKGTDDDDSGDDKGGEDDSDDDDSKDDDKDDSKDDDKSDDDKDDDKRDDDDKGDDDKEDEEDTPKLSKDLIKEALREMNQETKVSEADHKGLQKEVIETLFPEGIDRQLKDSEGDPITGIEDLKKLENPKTGELFTDEEAAQWLLTNQQKLNQDIEKIEAYASEIVDTNLSLKEGAERVETLYGELLKTMPDVAEQLLKAYQNTLVKDQKTGIVIKAPVDVVEFYNIALAGYKQVAEQMEQKKAAEDAQKKAADAKKAKESQQDRSDLGQKGSAKPNLTGEDKEWDGAYDSYYNQ